MVWRAPPRETAVRIRGGRVEEYCREGSGSRRVRSPTASLSSMPRGGQWTAGELLSGAEPTRPRAASARRAALRSRRHAHPELGRAVPDAAGDLPGRLAVRRLNTHLTAAEVGYILGDSGAAALIADAAFGDVARKPPNAPACPPAGRIAVCGEIPGFTPLADVLAGQPDTAPDDRVAGQFMQYTSGTTGRPKAVQRDLPQFDPESWVGGLQRQPHALRHRGRRRRSASRHVADVPPVAAELRILLVAPRAHRRADGAVGRRTRVAADRRGTASPTWRWCRRRCTGSWRCPTTSARSTTCRHCARSSTRRRRARSTSSCGCSTGSAR